MNDTFNHRKTIYVVGFMFSEDFERVVLIRKNKPAWQAAKLNGVGGKREDTESSPAAMAREFKEETGMDTMPEQWRSFAYLNGIGNTTLKTEWEVHCFATVATSLDVKTITDEPVGVYHTRTMCTPFALDMIENLAWLIALAIDTLRDGRPYHVTVTYPPNP